MRRARRGQGTVVSPGDPGRRGTTYADSNPGPVSYRAAGLDANAESPASFRAAADCCPNTFPHSHTRADGPACVGVRTAF